MRKGRDGGEKGAGKRLMKIVATYVIASCRTSARTPTDLNAARSCQNVLGIWQVFPQHIFALRMGSSNFFFIVEIFVDPCNKNFVPAGFEEYTLRQKL